MKVKDLKLMLNLLDPEKEIIVCDNQGRTIGTRLVINDGFYNGIPIKIKIKDFENQDYRSIVDSAERLKEQCENIIESMEDIILEYK